MRHSFQYVSTFRLKPANMVLEKKSAGNDNKKNNETNMLV
jgi:hypothetical protein